jgi:hypothetical protein
VNEADRIEMEQAQSACWTDEDVRLAAKRGHALMAEHFPRHLARVRQDLLRMQSCTLCVLGQGFGEGDGWGSGRAVISCMPAAQRVEEESGLPWMQWETWYGFDIPTGAGHAGQWDVLDAAWLELLGGE